MTGRVVLASASTVRRELLSRAGIDVVLSPARIDEPAITAALRAEGAGPRDLADALAEMKALRVAGRHGPADWIIGADQVLDLDGRLFDKPRDRAEARAHLLALRGRTHRLHSAAVIVQDGAPVWRHMGVVRMTMRPFSESWLEAYLDRAWPAVAGSVGGYRIEDEGLRLFSRIEGDYFHVLGLPLLEILVYLGDRGAIPA